MTAGDLELLYAYGTWANGKLMQVISQITPDEFARSVAGSYGSIRNTLVHVLSAEWGWLERCGGRARGPRLDPDDYPAVESLVSQWSKVEGYRNEFLSTLKDEDLDWNIEFSVGESVRSVMSMGELLHHGAIHGRASSRAGGATPAIARPRAGQLRHPFLLRRTTRCDGVSCPAWCADDYQN